MSKIYFVAFEAKHYSIDAIKIELTWGQRISDWLHLLEEYNINDEDTVIGHSVGGAVALLYGKGNIKAISPSPIMTDADHLLTEEMKRDLPFMLEEGIEYMLKECNAEIYVGNDEPEVMKKTAELITDKINSPLTIVKDADHMSILDTFSIQYEK